MTDNTNIDLILENTFNAHTYMESKIIQEGRIATKTKVTGREENFLF